jgi:hypothetical protein
VRGGAHGEDEKEADQAAHAAEGLLMDVLALERERLRLNDRLAEQLLQQESQQKILRDALMLLTGAKLKLEKLVKR